MPCLHNFQITAQTSTAWHLTCCYKTFLAMEIEATNLRKDYKFLTIKSHFGKYLVEYYSNRVPGHRSEIFATMQAAKRFCTMDIQNPKWGKDYPKLQWRAKANVL